MEQLSQEIRHELRNERLADFLEVLHEYRERLQRIPLESNDQVDTAQAFRDAVREDVILNGVQFVGEHRMEAYISAIKRIVAKSTPDHFKCLEISDRIVKSCSRTSTGADAYFTIEKLFVTPSLLLKPRQKKLPPLEITLGLDHDKLKCRIVTVNLFGLYRHEDIEKTFVGSSQNDLEAWIKIDTRVVECIDFSRGKSTRYLTIQTPQTVPEISTEVKELF